MSSATASGFQPWDVVVVPFPYSERRVRAFRPAVIVSSEMLARKTGRYFVAMITSAENASVYGDVEVSDLRACGLPVRSVVRPAKLTTLEPSRFRRIGALPVTDRRRVAGKLREFFPVIGS